MILAKLFEKRNGIIIHPSFALNILISTREQSGCSESFEAEIL